MGISTRSFFVWICLKFRVDKENPCPVFRCSACCIENQNGFSYSMKMYNQHPATLPTSPNHLPVSPFKGMEAHRAHLVQDLLGIAWDGLSSRCYTTWDDSILKLTRLTNVGIFSKSTDQLWNPNGIHPFLALWLCESTTSCWTLNRFRRQQKAENLMPTDALQCRSSSPTVPSTTRATPKSNCLKVSFSHCLIHGYPWN